MSTSRATLPPRSALDPILDRFDRWRSRLFGDPAVPTLMHITHAKAGSTWISRMFADLFPTRVAPRGRAVTADGDLDRHVFAPGRIYRGMFLSRQKFLLHPELQDCLRFIVIRDLRDTLVSLYFSMKFSHQSVTAGRELRHRAELQELGVEDGLLHLIENELPGAARMQESWVGQGEILLHYEDLLADGFPILRELLIDRFALRPLRTERDYDAAVAVLDSLAVRPEGSLDPGEQDYLDTLTLLVEEYDRQHFKVDTETGDPLSMLKYLMNESAMTQADLGRLLGNRALASLILNGHRQLSKSHIRKLADHFKVGPALFL